MPRRAALLVCCVFASCAPIGERLPERLAIDGYRVVYSVEERTPGAVDVRTEVREVRRPFDGRVEVREGAPPGGRINAGSVVNERYQWAIATDGVLRVGFRRPPGGPVADASYDGLKDAAANGAALALGTGEALGRRCAWFAYGEPIGPLVLPSDDSRVESCVDGAGILLRQVWSIRGTVARIVEATAVATTSPHDDRFLTDRKPRKPGGGDLDRETLLQSAVAVDDDEEPVDLAVAIDPPKGWKLARDAVVAESGGQGAPPSQTYAEAYVRGGELTVVERSTSPERRPLWSPSEGKRVTLGDLGEGRVVYFVDRVEVRLVGTLGYARIRAPSRETALLFARSLRPAN